MRKLLTSLLCRWESDHAFSRFYDPKIDINALHQAGFLQFDCMLESVHCGCCDGDVYDIRWIEKAGRDQPVALLVAPCCRGMQELGDEQLKSWKVNPLALMQAFCDAVQIQGQIAEFLPDLIWKLGRRHRREYFFLGAVDHEKLRVLIPELSNHPKAILIAATKRSADIVRGFTPHTCFALEEIAEMSDDGQLSFDQELIRQYVPSLSDEDRKKATPRRASRANGIEILTDIMKDHARAVCEHADFMGRNGQFEFIPRPTQQKLAEMAGISQATVFRCLDDTSAVVLKLLWENSETERGIEVLRRFL